MTHSTQWMPWHPWASGAKHSDTRGPARPIPARGWVEWRINKMIDMPPRPWRAPGTMGKLFAVMLDERVAPRHDDIEVRRLAAEYINRHIAKHTSYQGLYNARSCKGRDYVWLEVKGVA